MLIRFQRAVPVLLAYALLLTAGLQVREHLLPVIVSGGSMRPALSPGDVVLVAQNRAPRVGEIALIRSGRSLVLHRVTRVMSDGSIMTRGDANPVADFQPTQREDIRGPVRLVVPAGVLLERWRRRAACDTLPAQTHTARR